MTDSVRDFSTIGVIGLGMAVQPHGQALLESSHRTRFIDAMLASSAAYGAPVTVERPGLILGVG